MVFRLEWNDGQARDGAVLFGVNPPASLRIGSAVLVRTDGGDVVLDADRMATAPSAPRDPGRKKRGVPDAGVDDKALDWRVQSRLKKWRPERGTIVSHERVTAIGILTDNWNIVVTKEDGSSASASRDNIPSYTRWFVHPGSEVPIVVDPGKPASMQIDWPLLAEERAGGSWDDAPPEGSIAADLVANRQGPPVEAATMGAEIDFTPSDESVEAIEGVTLQQWALIEASLIQDRVPPNDYDAYATERFGVPAGRWTPIVAAWNTRMQGDWRVGAAYGEAHSAAAKQVKQAAKDAKKKR
jgi:hypothetical protein